MYSNLWYSNVTQYYISRTAMEIRVFQALFCDILDYIMLAVMAWFFRFNSYMILMFSTFRNFLCLFVINSSKNYGKFKPISQIYFSLQRKYTNFWITPLILYVLLPRILNSLYVEINQWKRLMEILLKFSELNLLKSIANLCKIMVVLKKMFNSENFIVICTKGTIIC